MSALCSADIVESIKKLTMLYTATYCIRMRVDICPQQDFPKPNQYCIPKNTIALFIKLSILYKAEISLISVILIANIIDLWNIYLTLLHCYQNA